MDINLTENHKIEFKCLCVGVRWLHKCVRLREGVPQNRTKTYKGDWKVQN